MTIKKHTYVTAFHDINGHYYELAHQADTLEEADDYFSRYSDITGGEYIDIVTIDGKITS